uniref:NADH dehydrogenase subunit 2 n=1 Tax=Symphyocladia marchantioides TaxID=88360 RepID=UPI0022FD8AC1|nr:NADH dehydrogenase subunit 2 [Symphyocladia marchantioides]WAX04055.1 NADH dehydrogenase subunit 2 [Symphyocladia marchantioides]
MILNTFYLSSYPLLVEVFLLLISCFCLLFGSIYHNSSFAQFPILMNSIRFFSLQGLVFSFILLVSTSPLFFTYWNNLLINDSLAFYGKFLILFFAIVWFLIFPILTSILNFEFWILILLSIVALSLLVQAFDLLSIYLLIEFLSLTFYILTSINRDSEFSTESGLKYFILGAFTSSLLLFGFTLLYNFTGLTNLQDFLIFFTNFSLSSDSFDNLNLGFFLSFFFILTALLFKLGAAPFHFWIPDVYEGALNLVTGFFAILPKIAILTLLIRFIFLTFGDYLFSEMYLFLIICTFLSSLIGTFGAFIQTKWKRFIAFSSITHISFFLLNLCSLNSDHLTYLFTYLLIYLIMSSSFFGFFAIFTKFNFPISFTPRFLNSLIFLKFTNQPLAILFTFILFSFAGIPPLAGFFAKFFVLYSGISASLFFLVLSLLLLNCISCFYYINLIRKNYFYSLNFSYLPVINSSAKIETLVVFNILIFLILFFVLEFDSIFLFSNLLRSTFLN